MSPPLHRGTAWIGQRRARAQCLCCLAPGALGNCVLPDGDEPPLSFPREGRVGGGGQCPSVSVEVPWDKDIVPQALALSRTTTSEGQWLGAPQAWLWPRPLGTLFPHITPSGGGPWPVANSASRTDTRGCLETGFPSLLPLAHGCILVGAWKPATQR